MSGLNWPHLDCGERFAWSASGSWVPSASSRPHGQPVFQLRILLEDVDPVIWRRVLVLGSVRLSKLHDMFQAAMGWTDSHLHAFLARPRVAWVLHGRELSVPDHRDRRRQLPPIRRRGPHPLHQPPHIRDPRRGRGGDHRKLTCPRAPVSTGARSNFRPAFTGLVASTHLKKGSTYDFERTPLD
jgi:hypothetical protein